MERCSFRESQSGTNSDLMTVQEAVDLACFDETITSHKTLLSVPLVINFQCGLSRLVAGRTSALPPKSQID